MAHVIFFSENSKAKKKTLACGWDFEKKPKKKKTFGVWVGL